METEDKKEKMLNQLKESPQGQAAKAFADDLDIRRKNATRWTPYKRIGIVLFALGMGLFFYPPSRFAHTEENFITLPLILVGAFMSSGEWILYRLYLLCAEYNLMRTLMQKSKYPKIQLLFLAGIVILLVVIACANF